MAVADRQRPISVGLRRHSAWYELLARHLQHCGQQPFVLDATRFDLLFDHSMSFGHRRVLASLRREAVSPQPVGATHDEQAEHDKTELHDRSDLWSRERQTSTIVAGTKATKRAGHAFIGLAPVVPLASEPLRATAAEACKRLRLDLADAVT